MEGFIEKNYPAGKNDLATAFLDRCLEFCVEGGEFLCGVAAELVVFDFLFEISGEVIDSGYLEYGGSVGTKGIPNANVGFQCTVDYVNPG